MDQKPDHRDKPEHPSWDVPLEDPQELQIEPPSTCAGGIPAILSTLKHTTGSMGIIRGAQALFRMNQQKGFDCPGCGWPEPDGHRAVTEFCENGAKAVAQEGTKKPCYRGVF